MERVKPRKTTNCVYIRSHRLQTHGRRSRYPQENLLQRQQARTGGVFSLCPRSGWLHGQYTLVLEHAVAVGTGVQRGAQTDPSSEE